MSPTLEEVGLAVKRVQWRHHREANRRLAALGLSLVQWDVIRHLHQQPEASLHRLAELTFQTDQSMGELARRMVERGLIERRDAPGRAIKHALTRDGRRAHDAGAAVMRGVFQETLGTLSADQRAVLHDLLVQVANA